MGKTPRLLSALMQLSLVVGVTALTTAQESVTLVVPVEKRQLFLDDVDLAAMNGLKCTMHQPSKKGAVIRPDYLNLGERHFQIRNAPSWDPERGVFRFLLTETSGPRSVSWAWDSYDGLHWWRVGKSNRAVYTVVYDSNDPDPARRYKSISPRHVAVSPDMLTWTVLGNPRIAASDEHNLSFDEQSGLFILTVKRGGPYGRSHALLTSDNLENVRAWTDFGVLFHADDLDQQTNRDEIKALMENLVADEKLEETDFYGIDNYVVDVYNTPVFRYETHYLALPAIHPSVTMDLKDPSDNIAFKIPQLMSSRDMVA